MKTLMRKSDFAKRCGVSKGRVSQWLKAGQIDGAAIVGTGRGAPLDAALALAQLKLRLSVDERFGLNGLGTNLDWLPADEEEDADAEAEAADLAEIEADRRRHVTLLAAKTAVDNLWILMDLRVQAALKPHAEAAAAYLAVRPGLADAKWRIQGVEPPVSGG
jgi:transcriptional regulator with XRE-family HTH domain